MFDIYISIAAFISVCVVAIRVGLYLPAFFVLCYMLPFLPVVPAVYSNTAHFWTGDAFSYEINSLEVLAISAVWLASSLGCILGFGLQKVALIFPSHTQKGVAWVFDNCVFNKRLRFLVIYILASLFVGWRLIIEGDAGGDVIFGGETIVCVFLLFTILVAWKRNNIFLSVLCAFLASFYIFAQVLYGDRDFFTIIVALMLFFSANRLGGYAGMLKLVAVGTLIVGIGALISMLRMSVDVSFDEFIGFFYYNSWTATIQPVLLMLQSEWNAGPTLFGKSYLDLILSFVPSVVYSMFDLVKPISSDNPALWFYVEGMGGMHAAGVAWRNFGLAGVFFQCAAAVVLLSKIEKYMVSRHTFWASFFYMTIASQLMHTVWYSLVSMVNVLVLFIIIYCFFSFEKIIGRRPAWVLSRCRRDC